MKRATVVIDTSPCMASTAGTPTSASRGPSAASTPPSSLRRSSGSPALWQEASTISRGSWVRSRMRSTSALPDSGAARPSASSSSSTASPPLIR